MARESTGKVKLRRANGQLMLTIPKNIQTKVEQLTDKTFEASYTKTSLFDMIIFSRKRTYKVTLGKSANDREAVLDT